MKRTQWIITGFLLIIKFALPFLLFNPAFELHRDEYLYYEQGRHLDVGYLENPPLIGFLAYLSSVFGGGFFWIKFWPALFGGGTLWVTVQTVKEMGGSTYAQTIAGLGVIFSAYLRTHFLFQPNFLDIFFWALGAYYLLHYINTKAVIYIFLLALSLVLGWYGKYSVLFFIMALMLSLLLTYHHTIFLRKQFWIALLLALTLIAPNILWQYYHNWPLMHHMKELQETQLQHLNRLDFIKEQVLMLFPVAFLWIGGLVWLLGNKKYRVIAYCYLFIIVLLTMGSGKGYYALGAYPMLLAAGGVWSEEISVRKLWLRYAFVLLILALSLLFVPLLLPVQNPAAMAVFNKRYGIENMGVLRWEDDYNHSLQQDFADMLGWKELTVKTEKFFNTLPDSSGKATVIYCRNYGLAGALKYYAKHGGFRDGVVSDNGSFLLWLPGRFYFKNIILIGRDKPALNEELFQGFETSRVIDSCTNPLSRQFGCKIFFFQNAGGARWLLAQKKFAEMKQIFSR